MSEREIIVRVPSTWTRDELEERLRRLREPLETAAQRAKSGNRVELESRTVAALVGLAEELRARIELLEADRSTTVATRSDLDEVRELLANTAEATAGALDRADALAAQLRAAEAQIESTAEEVYETTAFERGKLWEAIGHIREESTDGL
jgi:uncharacterized coiled-coil DUF342 family protein